MLLKIYSNFCVLKYIKHKKIYFMLSKIYFMHLKFFFKSKCHLF